jgi:hypothetical protein
VFLGGALAEVANAAKACIHRPPLLEHAGAPIRAFDAVADGINSGWPITRP